MVKRSPLDDPRIAQHAWARYKRLMKFMLAFTILVVIVALGAIYWQNGMISPHFFIATALGVGFSMLLMSALMGLVFLSSGSGHDEAIDDGLDNAETWGTTEAGSGGIGQDGADEGRRR